MSWASPYAEGEEGYANAEGGLGNLLRVERLEGAQIPIFITRVLVDLINLSIFAILGALRPTAFLSWTNIKAVLSLMSYDLLIAIGMTIVLIVRGIDLSVGSVMALSTVTMALLMRADVPVLPALGAGLIVALSCGLVNGLLIAKGGILPFLVTLGMMSVARGIATVLTTGQYISFPNAAPWFTQFGNSNSTFNSAAPATDFPPSC